MKKIKNTLMILVVILMAGNSFAGSFDWKGDLRLRYESRDDDGKQGRGRARYRLRLGTEIALDDNWTVGFRLASGSDADPTSTNQSMDDLFTKKSMWIDRAYAVYKSGDFKFTAGKQKNPFNSTWIVWDSDINLEGVSEQFRWGNNGYITLGQYVLNENSSTADSYLLSGQVGFKFEMVSLNLAYYSYSHYLDQSPAAGGNVLVDGLEFSIIDLLAEVKVSDNVSLWFNYVNNSDAVVLEGMDGDKKDSAMGAEVTFKNGDWKFGLGYASIEANAVVGAFSDSDFGQADREGFKFSAGKKLGKKVSFKMTYFILERESDGEKGRNMAQFDLSYKF